MQHVRPGLTCKSKIEYILVIFLIYISVVTQEEYDSVKGVVLDLLGWGVDFKYLLEYGINKSLLYYVFNELKPLSARQLRHDWYHPLYTGGYS